MRQSNGHSCFEGSSQCLVKASCLARSYDDLIKHGSKEKYVPKLFMSGMLEFMSGMLEEMTSQSAPPQHTALTDTLLAAYLLVVRRTVVNFAFTH